MTVKILVDVGDIYHKLNRRYEGKLDYTKYLNAIETRFGEISHATAYGSQSKDEAASFIACLRSIGFDTKYKRPRIFTVNDREIKQCHWGVDITLEALDAIVGGGGADVIVLGVSSTDYIPLIQALQRQSLKVIIFASGVPNVMRKVADEVIEITPDLFEEVPDEDC
jgi:uncharacterized LabA/DUF88 family protein